MSIKPGYPINKIFMIYFIIVYYVAKVDHTRLYNL